MALRAASNWSEGFDMRLKALSFLTFLVVVSGDFLPNSAYGASHQSRLVFVINNDSKLCMALTRFYNLSQAVSILPTNNWLNPAFEDTSTSQVKLAALGLFEPSISNDFSYPFERLRLRSALYKKGKFTSSKEIYRLFLQDFPIGTAGSTFTRIWLADKRSGLEKGDNDRSQLDLLPPIADDQDIYFEVSPGDYNNSNQPFRVVLGPLRYETGKKVFSLGTGAVLQRPFIYHGNVVYVARDEFPVRFPSV